MSTANATPEEKTLPSNTPTVHPLEGPEPRIEAACESAPDEPPDGGYGWVVVVAIVFMNAATWGSSADK